MSDTGNFILTLLHAATNAHLLHLKSRSYSEHMALGTFYQALPDLVDALVESIQGSTGQILEYPVDYYQPADSAIQELEELQEFVREERKSIPQDSEIQNSVDNIAELINSTLYKLRFLK